MAPAAVHPSDDALAAYGLGRLDDPAAAEVARHLEACPACKRRVAEQPADSFVGRLRDAVGPRADTSRPESSVADRPAGLPAPAALPPELAAATEYADVRELGRGGMGVVYLARNTLMDRLEVLKVVTRSSDRFVREIQAAARLKHPNVVGAYAARRLGDLLVFAMEYVPGEDLARLVKARGPLPIPHACNYVAQAALGLQHAHEQGMVHRDIKPSNLILTRVGDKPVVKVLDFGLAKGTSETPVDAGLTAEGAMLGTPDYVAPEQTLDAAKADVRSDVYSLGCTLFHLLAGRPPFIGRSLYEILRAHHSVEAPRLTTLRPEVPAELAAVVAKMMAKDPARRYPTPAAVVTALTPFFKPAARPASPSVSLARPALGKLVPAPAPKGPPPLPPPADPTPAPIARAPAALRPVGRPRGRVAGGVAVALVLIGLGIAYAAGAFRVKTKEGTIVLEDLPPDAEVLVDGRTVTITRNGDEAVVTLLAGGPHGLKLKTGDREFRTSDVTVTLGGAPVRIRREDWVPAPEPPPIPPAGGDPVEPAPLPPPPTRAPKAGPDLFAARTTWRGVRIPEHGQYQGGTGFYELHVETRDGEKFTGHTLDNGPNRNPSAVTGTVRGDAIEWTEVPQFAPKRISKLRATRDGTVLTATFACHDNGTFANDGRAVLYRVPKPGEPKPDDFVPIFDGRSLAGWETHSTQAGGWKVNQFGKLVGSGPDLSHLYTKRDDYADVHVKVRAKINGAGNSGVFVRAGFGPAGDAKYPDGYEAQICTLDGQMKTGGLFRPLAGKNRPPVTPDRAPPPADEWFDLDVIADGPTVRVLVNGRETARAANQPAGPGGRIALQMFDSATEVEFASVAVKELSRPAAAKNRRAHDDFAGQWRIVGDELVQESTKGYTHLTFGDFNWTDYDFTCEVKRAAGAHEVYLRYCVSLGGYEVFGLGGWNNKWDFATSVPLGKLMKQRTAKSAGVPGDSWVTMRVKVRGTHCECYRDEKLVFRYDNLENRKGAPGLGTNATAARFRTIRVADASGNVLWAGLPELPGTVGAAPAIDPKIRAAVSNRGDWRLDGAEVVQGDARLGDCEIAFGDTAWTDYNFVCRAKQLGGRGEIGLTARVTEAGRYEWVRGRWTGDCDSLGSITRAEQPLERVRWRKTGKLDPDRWYTLELRVRGTAIQCLVDGESVFTADHPAHTAGRVGLRTYGTEARFRDLKVTDPAGKVLFEGLPDLPPKPVGWILDS